MKRKEGNSIDNKDFSNTVRPFETEMYNICKAILLYESDCCDVIQEALINAYNKLHTLRDDRYFKTWLFRILINQCNTMRKKQKRRLNMEYGILDNLQAEDRNYRELYNSIDTLKEDRRQAIILHYVNGYSIAEIADMLSVPIGTVKSRLHHARKELKELILEVNEQ
ncbi:MAG: RNA polymerase sigma factor [Lachnospiraceae bacterium]|nr:RNA polymerase sigma factor [Lachnospiraceae bacterium]